MSDGSALAAGFREFAQAIRMQDDGAAQVALRRCLAVAAGTNDLRQRTALIMSSLVNAAVAIADVANDN